MVQSADFPTTADALEGTNAGGNADAFLATLGQTPRVRVTAYNYDGVGRLVGAQESPGYVYGYDAAGNRTLTTASGVTMMRASCDAANQVVGWGYDAAGNLTSDGTTTYSYDGGCRC